MSFNTLPAHCQNNLFLKTNKSSWLDQRTRVSMHNVDITQYSHCDYNPFVYVLWQQRVLNTIASIMMNNLWSSFVLFSSYTQRSGTTYNEQPWNRLAGWMTYFCMCRSASIFICKFYPLFYYSKSKPKQNNWSDKNAKWIIFTVTIVWKTQKIFESHVFFHKNTRLYKLYNIITSIKKHNFHHLWKCYAVVVPSIPIHNVCLQGM